MSAYTKQNLKQVEDMAPKFGHDTAMEARFASRPLELERAGLSHQRLHPGARIPFGHRHEQQEEVYVVLSGSGRAKLDDELVELEALDALRVSPQVMRAFEAGPDGIELLVFGAPRTGDSPGDDVAELAPGWWDD
jgi:mannose-6-phosphate isomerase-like protein (cupin superfamily)